MYHCRGAQLLLMKGSIAHADISPLRGLVKQGQCTVGQTRFYCLSSCFLESCECGEELIFYE